MITFYYSPFFIPFHYGSSQCFLAEAPSPSCPARLSTRSGTTCAIAPFQWTASCVEMSGLAKRRWRCGQSSGQPTRGGRCVSPRWFCDFAETIICYSMLLWVCQTSIVYLDNIVGLLDEYTSLRHCRRFLRRVYVACRKFVRRVYVVPSSTIVLQLTGRDL
jgi:hypothetical protein